MPRFSDEQVRAIITRPTMYRVVEYPGHPEIKIAVKCLDDVELDGVRIEAQRRLRDVSKKRGWDVRETADLDPALLERWVEREILLRAFFDPDTIALEAPVPFFASELELSKLGSTGVSDLMELYTENQEWINPSCKLDDAAEEELLDLLGKGPSAELTLTAIEPSTLRRLLISTAKRLSDYRSGKSSTSEKSSSTTPSS